MSQMGEGGVSASGGGYGSGLKEARVRCVTKSVAMWVSKKFMEWPMADTGKMVGVL